MITIDINSDVGEGIGNEAALMPYLSACNIACGGHAGDDQTMLEVLAFAKKFSVKVGAHPSYPDRKNFGRHEMQISQRSLQQSLASQIERLNHLAQSLDINPYHVKPHGALYNKAARDPETAQLMIDTVLEINPNLKLYVPYNSVISKLAVSHLETVTEGFADRAYHTDYSLVSRKEPNAVLTSSEEVIKHVLPMIKEHKLKTIEGEIRPFVIDTLCVHGDTNDALEIVKSLHQKLIAEGIHIT